MSYEDFRASITEPALIAIAEHWNRVRSGRLMPAWRDVDPAEIKEHLSIVWAWRWEPRLGTFIGRLAGEDVIAVIGKNPHRKRMDHVLGQDGSKVVLARCKRCIDEPAVMHSHGKVYVLAARDGWGERIVMPLAADGTHGDGVFGATVYQFGSPLMASDKISVDVDGEITKFFPLV